MPAQVKNIVPKRYRDTPHTKVPRTKGCMKVCVKKNPYSGFRWLACALPDEVLIMEWFEPMQKFMELRSIKDVVLPQPLNLLEMLIIPEQKLTGDAASANPRYHTLPLLCVGVTTVQRRDDRVHFQLVDLNTAGGDGVDGSCNSSMAVGNNHMAATENPPALSSSNQGETDLEVTSVTQLEKDTILICYRSESSRIFLCDLNGHLPLQNVRRWSACPAS